MGIDNPMTRNTDWYPYNSQTEYIQARLREIEEIDEKIDIIRVDSDAIQVKIENLSDELETNSIEVSNLIVKKNEIERELGSMR